MQPFCFPSVSAHDKFHFGELSLIIPQTEGERWFYSVNVDSTGAFYRFFCYTGHKYIFL